MARTFTKTIATVKRMQRSANGNPRFLFVFTDGTEAHTAVDTMFAYEVVDPGWEGRTFEFMADGKGIFGGKEVSE